MVATGDVYTGEIVSTPHSVPAEAPSFAQNPVVTAGNSSLTVSYTAKANGAEITNYVIYLDGSVAAILAGNQISHIITGLVNGTQYTVKVAAVNSVGTTESSEVTAAPIGYSGGGGGGGVSTYSVKFVSNGGTEVNKISVVSGKKLESVPTPEKAGYTFEGWYTDSALTKPFDADTAITKSITLYAKWIEKVEEPEPEVPDDKPTASDFADVKSTAYYFDAVKWAVENSVTSGTSANTFSPDEECTRAQMVTFLWRAAGSPVADNATNPFADVSEGKYYYDAVMWAIENGITSGVSATSFDPNGKVSRAQSVTFLWRLAGALSAETANPFVDVADDAYYSSAVTWAVNANVTFGLTKTSFGPNDVCTRAQIVTFIYRHFVK